MYNIILKNKMKYMLIIGFINLLYTYISVFIAQAYEVELFKYLEDTIGVLSIEFKIIKYIHVILLFISVWFIYYLLFDFLDKYNKSNLKVISLVFFPFVLVFFSIPLMFYYIYKILSHPIIHTY